MTTEALVIGGFYAVMVAIVSIALRWGDKTERQSAGMLAILAMLQVVASRFTPALYHTVDLVAVSIDLAWFTGFAWIGVHSKRFWPLLAAALQLLSLFSHLTRGLLPGVHPAVYAWMKSAPTFFVLVALLLGTLFYRRRCRLVARAIHAPKSTSGSTAR